MRRIIASLVILMMAAGSVRAAIDPAAVWRLSSTGNVNNGGLFVAASAGTDWSQDDAAKEAQTDGACADHTGPTYTFTSAAASFSTDDVAGNGIRIYDTGATAHFAVGWYEVKSVNSETSVELDRDPTDGIDETGGDYKLGGSIALGSTSIDNEIWAAASGNGVRPGNTVYVKGTWTLSEAINATANDCTAATPIRVIGCDASWGVNPSEADRPDWTGGAYNFSTGDYWSIKNIDMTGTGTGPISFSSAAGCILDHSKVANSSITAGRAAVVMGSNGVVINCELVSTLGDAVQGTAAGMRVDNCNIHDSDYGIDASNLANLTAYKNVIYNCTSVGVAIGTGGAANVLLNTIRTCGKGITANKEMPLILDNIIDDCATAEIEFTTDYFGYLGYNCWGEASPTLTNTSLSLQAGNVSADPGLANPAGGDFTVGAGSCVLDAGLQVGTNVGLVGDYQQNIGVDGDDNDVAGGTGGTEKTFNVGFY